MTESTTKKLLDGLRIDEVEHWDDGTVVEWTAVPFSFRRKPVVPSRRVADAKTEIVSVGSLNASQSRVTVAGVAKYLSGKHEPILVYAEDDGTYTIGDGTHRAVAATLRGRKTIRARVVR